MIKWLFICFQRSLYVQKWLKPMFDIKWRLILFYGKTVMFWINDFFDSIANVKGKLQYNQWIFAEQ